MRAVVVGIALLFSQSQSQAADLSYRTLSLLSMKYSGTRPDAATVDDYMKVFRPAAWAAAQKNELQLKKERPATIDVVEGALNTFNASEPIIINTEVPFGEYDTERRAFSFHPLDENSNYVVSQDCCSTLPTRLSLYIENPDFIDGIPMTEGAAEAFLLARRGTSGYVDRSVLTTIYVVPTRAMSETEMVGKLVRVTIRDRRNANRILLETPSGR